MFDEILPIIKTNKANKKLKEKINNQDIEPPEDLDDINIEFLQEDYLNVFDTKNRLEDKAKTIIAALTIAITLILNLSKVIETIASKFQQQYMSIFVFFLAVSSIVYMLVAGILAIQVLIKENIIYPISLQDRTKKNKEKYYKITQSNVNQNLIRNNIIFSAYRMIRNSVICLVIIFVLSICPSFQVDEIVSLDGGKYESENINFGLNAVEWLRQNPEFNISVENLIEYNKSKIMNSQNSVIYDDTNNVKITVEYRNGSFKILDIKSKN